jgi:hypothetical protein
MTCMTGNYISTPNTSLWRGAELSNGYIFIAWYLVKHKNNFTLIYLPEHTSCKWTLTPTEYQSQLQFWLQGYIAVTNTVKLTVQVLHFKEYILFY